MATPPRPNPAELQQTLGAPLPPSRLAQIWAGLPEQERLGFIHSLDEVLVDSVMAACCKCAAKPSSKS